MSIITVATAPHAGQHSVVKRLENDNSVLVPLKNISTYWEQHNSLEILDPNKTNIITGSVLPQVCEFLEFINKKSRLIVPIRDPLLIIISGFMRHEDTQKGVVKNVYSSPSANIPVRKISSKRKSEQNIGSVYKERKYKYTGGELSITPSIVSITHQVISLRTLVERLDELSPLYVPVDLDQDLHYNSIDLSNLGVYASYGDYPLKTAYHNNDLKFIRENLRENYDALKCQETLLRPLLEKIGYKDLLWWD
jgi:hypothetical protein